MTPRRQLAFLALVSLATVGGCECQKGREAPLKAIQTTRHLLSLVDQTCIEEQGPEPGCTRRALKEKRDVIVERVLSKEWLHLRFETPDVRRQTVELAGKSANARGGILPHEDGSQVLVIESIEAASTMDGEAPTPRHAGTFLVKSNFLVEAAVRRAGEIELFVTSRSGDSVPATGLLAELTITRPGGLRTDVQARPALDGQSLVAHVRPFESGTDAVEILIRMPLTDEPGFSGEGTVEVQSGARQKTVDGEVGVELRRIDVVIGGGGVSPSKVRVRIGEPVRFIFSRIDPRTCPGSMTSPALRLGFQVLEESIALDLIPATAGRFELTCEDKTSFLLEIADEQGNIPDVATPQEPGSPGAPAAAGAGGGPAQPTRQ